MTTPSGVRDRALLLLLATTGLRNKELRSLEFHDIHWRAAEVLVRRTKTGRDRLVPLLQETGEALADYILHARPKIDSQRVFLSYVPPVGPFKSSSPISRIVRSRLERAGIKLSRVAGAHLVRHSLATQLVKQRRPINEVADLLGHRSIDTTAIYVKVALPQLARHSALSGGRQMSTFAKLLADRVEGYIALRRSLGYEFEKSSAILRRLARYVGAGQLDGPLTRDMAIKFIFSWEGTANGRAINHGILRRFCEHLAIYDARTEALDPRELPRSRAIPPARILSDEELGSLISASSRVSPRYPQRGLTLTMLVGLLASTGLRSGEALRLNRTDVDLADGILHIRKTKFRKDRLVPVHTTTLAALCRATIKVRLQRQSG